MTKKSAVQAGTMGVLLVGAVIGYIAAQVDFMGRVASADTKDSVASGSPNAAASEESGAESTLIEKVESSPNAIPLNPKSGLKDVRVMFNDFKNNPNRDPGPIDIQRTVGGMAFRASPHSSRRRLH